LNSFPHGRFWQLVYKNKENVRCTRLMPRSLHNNNTTKVRDLDVIVPAHPPRLMPTEFQLLVYILHLLRVDMTD
jgi:hypothetical protein